MIKIVNTLTQLLAIIAICTATSNSSAQSLTYNGAGFTENPVNDGSVNGLITARLDGDTFTH